MKRHFFEDTARGGEATNMRMQTFKSHAQVSFDSWKAQPDPNNKANTGHAQRRTARGIQRKVSRFLGGF